jgi:hypothetical protein
VLKCGHCSEMDDEALKLYYLQNNAVKEAINIYYFLPGYRFIVKIDFYGTSSPFTPRFVYNN